MSSRKRISTKRPVLVSKRALRNALQSLGYTPGSEKALQCLQDQVSDFVIQLVVGTAEECKQSFQKTRGRKMGRHLSKQNIKLSHVRAALEKPGRTFCASGVPRLLGPLDMHMLPASRVQPPCARQAPVLMTVNPFFIGD